MKLTIKLESIPLSVEIEGPDESMDHMVDVATQTLVNMRKVWLETVRRQSKLPIDRV